jgi:hypothetical protein
MKTTTAAVPLGEMSPISRTFHVARVEQRISPEGQVQRVQPPKSCPEAPHNDTSHPDPQHRRRCQDQCVWLGPCIDLEARQYVANSHLPLGVIPRSVRPLRVAEIPGLGCQHARTFEPLRTRAGSSTGSVGSGTGTGFSATRGDGVYSVTASVTGNGFCTGAM